MAKVYLSRSEIAQRIGVKNSTLSRYRLPKPDVILGATTHRPIAGWAEETIDRWNASRPGLCSAKFY